VLRQELQFALKHAQLKKILHTPLVLFLFSLCGELSIVVLPFLGHLRGLNDQTFGAWAGAAVHNVGQVVATASVWSEDALKTAVVIKLARVCLLAPIVLILSIRHRHYFPSTGQTEIAGKKAPIIPVFVLGFNAVAVIQNFLTIPDSLHSFVVLLSKVLRGFGLVALGSGVRWRAIRAIDPLPMVMGLIAWVIAGGVSLAEVIIAGI